MQIQLALTELATLIVPRPYSPNPGTGLLHLHAFLIIINNMQIQPFCS